MESVSSLIRISEIFYSLQGESLFVGLPTVFIRLTGCPLRCHYCDTTYAFRGGERMTLHDILTRTAAFNCTHICVTGGEPLAQPECISLLTALCDAGYTVSLETSGAHCIAAVDPRVVVVMDVKSPDSGEVSKNYLPNFDRLKATDQIKFVLCSRTDYEWACTFIETHHLRQRAQILFSPSWNQLAPTTLADWIVTDRLPVRFQLQLHKILWNDAPGR